MTLTRALGKAPANPELKHVRLGDYLDATKLTVPAGDFGHETLISTWPMYGNDKVGDCAFAGAYHEEMLWNAEASKAFKAGDATVLAAYSKFTGYDPSQTDANGNNPTDVGTDVGALAQSRVDNGLLDDGGVAHKLGGYVALDAGNVDQLWIATYLFDGVGIGVSFPDEWETAFDSGKPWDALAKFTNGGGHYVPGVCRRNGLLGIVTWGELWYMTEAGYKQFNDESYAYLTAERINTLSAKTLDGVDMAQLTSDLAVLNKQ